ncbi:MAG TPA: AMP-binding protein [Jatrophihabitans sp.]|nr:AMP-binding protein [Jatrophihabitans sp.]
MSARSITELLADAAARTPDAIFLRMAEGELTYAETEQLVARTAGGLQRVGVRAGEPVVLLMHNSLDQVVCWFALARLGAVHVPVNTALVGTALVHVFRVTGARLAIVDSELLPGLLAVRSSLDDLQQLVVRGVHPVDEVQAISLDAVQAATPIAPVTVGELDPATVLFTSGTTGPSKGCVLSHRYLVRQAELHATNLGLRQDDVLYAPFPLFHIDAATLTVCAALSVGGVAAIGRRFSASRFWEEVRRFDASVFNFLGATLTMLWKQPPTPGDRDHRVRLAWGVPMPSWQREWERRFDIPLYELYGLTDAGIPAYDHLDGPKPTGSCGRVIDEYEVVIVDDIGRPVPADTVGEITVRGREPGLVMNEYWAMPEATAAALRDGRIHTGDLGRLDAHGFLYFEGRKKDAIRRRGENISAFEVEQVLLAHPEIVEAAAIGVASELTEQDVKVCVVLRGESTLTYEDIHEHCVATAPKFMVPRYIEIVSSLPKTPTQKIEKFRLQAQPLTDATWDAEARKPVQPQST